MLLQEGFCITDLLDANGDDFESGELDRWHKTQLLPKL